MTVKRFGDLQVGDVIRGKDGQDVVVTAAYDEHIPEAMYEIEFDNGETIKASGNHLWYVETDYDQAYHRERVRSSKRVLKEALSKEMLDNLDALAHSEDEIETSLMDMTNLVEAYDKSEVINVLQRIAESIGHVSENKGTYEDLLTGEQMENPTSDVRHYDAKIFAQQILSLTGSRKYKKAFPTIVGRVMTTENMIDISETANIPVMTPKKRP